MNGCPRCLDATLRIEEQAKEIARLQRDIEATRTLSPMRLRARIEQLETALEQERRRSLQLDEALKAVEGLSKRGGK